MRASDQAAIIAYYDCDGAGCAVVARRRGHSGVGWYVWCAEYPEEGAAYLGRELASWLRRKRLIAARPRFLPKPAICRALAPKGRAGFLARHRGSGGPGRVGLSLSPGSGAGSIP